MNAQERVEDGGIETSTPPLLVQPTENRTHWEDARAQDLWTVMGRIPKIGLTNHLDFTGLQELLPSSLLG